MRTISYQKWLTSAEAHELVRRGYPRACRKWFTLSRYRAVGLPEPQRLRMAPNADLIWPERGLLEWMRRRGMAEWV